MSARHALQTPAHRARDGGGSAANTEAMRSCGSRSARISFVKAAAETDAARVASDASSDRRRLASLSGHALSSAPIVRVAWDRARDSFCRDGARRRPDFSGGLSSADFRASRPRRNSGS